MLKHPSAAALLLAAPGIFGLLPDRARETVFGHLVAPVAGGGLSAARLLGLRRARVLASAGLLSPRQADAVRATVDETPYRELQSAGVPLEAYADRLLDDLRSRTWGRQNPAASAIGNAGPEEVGGLPAETQEQLGRNVLQSAEGASRGAEGLLARVRRLASSWPEPFVRGLLLETLVNDEGRFRLKGGHLAEVLAVVLSCERAEETLGRAAGAVLTSGVVAKSAEAYLPGRGWVDQYEETTAILEEAGRGSPGKAALLDGLKRAVRLARPDDAEGPGG